MRLALVQFNPTVGDLAGNARGIVEWAAKARAQGADGVVFPELTLCGYPPKDLLLQQGFLDDCNAMVEHIAREAPRDATVIFGAPVRVPGASGSSPPAGIANALVAVRSGRITNAYHKRLLPTYDVFDEDRYFVAGEAPCVVDIAGVRVGLSICEDLWRGEDVGFSARYQGREDPVEALIAAGAQVIVNPSASPFLLGKGERHRAILRRHAARWRVPVAGVNQVGGNDELLFDGHAAAYAADGSPLAFGPGFEEAVVVIDVPPAAPPAPPPTDPPPTDPLLAAPPEELLFRALAMGVRDYCRKTGFSKVVLGLSGGIDSAVTGVLAAAALGPAQVLGVGLPSKFSSEGSITDARALAANLGVPFEVIPIEPGVQALNGALRPVFAAAGKEAFGLAEENLQSRVRGTLLMALSNKLDRLLLTTGNKSELAVGYCTLYGDMNGGLAVLSDVSKQWVYRLARWMNAHPAKLGIETAPGRTLDRPPIPEASITKPPSAELRPNQVDQDSLPPYDLLDRIIECYVEARLSPRAIVERLSAEGFPRGAPSTTGATPTDLSSTVARVVRMIDTAEFKRKQAAIGLKVTGVAFGSGRRMPIAQRYRPTP